MDERLNELQKEVALKGFRSGKVPSSVIKSQFGKSIYRNDSIYEVAKTLSEIARQAKQCDTV